MTQKAKPWGFRSRPSSEPVGQWGIGEIENARRVSKRIRQVENAIGYNVTPTMPLKAILEGAPPGAVIRLGEGTFTITEQISLLKEIHIIGSGRATKLIFDDSAITAVSYVFAVLGDDSSLSKMTIQHGTGAFADRAINIFAAGVSINDCEITNLASTSGIVIANAKLRTRISHCRFTTTGPAAIGTADIYMNDTADLGVVCGCHNSIRDFLVDYKLGTTQGIGTCNIGATNIRP